MRPCALFSLFSSLFFLLSSIPPEDAERARPWRLHMRDGFCRRNHDPPLKCSDSSRRSSSLFRRDGVGKGRSPSGGLISGPLAASWGLSALFSLLSSLFSVLSSLSALFPLLSLPLISQIALRTCPFDIGIRPSTSPPTASTLCGTIPGPAECAKRLSNPATEPSGRR